MMNVENERETKKNRLYLIQKKENSFCKIVLILFIF